MAGVGEERARARCTNDPWRLRTSGGKGFERRKGEGRVEAEGERETMGSREGGEGRGDLVGSN